MKPVKYMMFFLFAALIGCEKDDQKRIPDAPVYLELDLYGQYSTFRNPLDTIVYDRRITVKDYIGFGGILINIDYSGRYCAYDLCCPYEVDPNIRVYPDESGMNAVCRSCGSTFEIWNGTGMVSKSPSRWNLKRYHTDVYNGVVYVSR